MYLNIKHDKMLDKCKVLFLSKYNVQKENDGYSDDVTCMFVV